MFPESHGFVAICRLKAASQMHVPIYLYLINEVILSKHVTKNKIMRKYMVEFPRKLRIVALKLL